MIQDLSVSFEKLITHANASVGNKLDEMDGSGMGISPYSEIMSLCCVQYSTYIIITIPASFSSSQVI